MSTLPFLLSVADELDNLNSQTYMDDFGLGFHPHRHYYRNPNHSIQLSLPASTDWIEEKQRCRSHKFVDESQNNCDDEGNNENASDGLSTSRQSNSNRPAAEDQDNIDNTVNMYNLSKKCGKYNHQGAVASTSQTAKKLNKLSPSPSSSSDESLQKTSTLSSLASIEFLTCFPVKKNKTPKSSSGSSNNSSGGNRSSAHKKSSS